MLFKNENVLKKNHKKKIRGDYILCKSIVSCRPVY